MAELNAKQTDALVELFNIGMSRAAKQLSLLLNDNIKMSVPNVSITSLEEIPSLLQLSVDEKLSCVYEYIDHQFKGYSILIFRPEESQILTGSFARNIIIPLPTDEQNFVREATLEIGNIIISAAISTMADLLGETVILSVPKYSLTTLDGLLIRHCKKYLSENSTARVIAITTKLQATHHNVTGILLIIFSLKSIEKLIKKLDLLFQ